MDAISRARGVFDMGREAGYTFTLLDIGGGFEDALFEQAAEVIRMSLQQDFPDRSNLKIIAEPGRFYVSKAFKLAVNIIARRAPPLSPATSFSGDIASSSDQPAIMCESSLLRIIASPDDPVQIDYISDGVYGAFNCILFDHQVVQPYVLFMKGSFHVADGEDIEICSVWGPTCDSIDCVSQKTALPCGLRVGDWLGFDNMGAYTICAASQFNGFEVSKVLYTTGGGADGFEVRDVLSRLACRSRGS
jgi:ornithine decarboxylase